MNLVRTIVGWCVRHDAIWRVLERSALRLSRHVEWARNEVERARAAQAGSAAGVSASLFARAFPADGSPLHVQRGPFRGLVYPSNESRGSALAPKLLGFYEWELQPLVERACRERYDCIVDVGCAEGYYAIGFARRVPSATVQAFDTDARSRELCGDMARRNDVAARVTVSGACTPQALTQLASAQRMLVFSDCEGYELELFTPDVARALARHDVLIECHDFIRAGITQELRRRFAATHDIVSVASVADEEKPDLCASAALDPFTREERRELLAERRPAAMTWLHLTPRANATHAAASSA